MQKFIWTDRVASEKIQRSVKEGRGILCTMKRRLNKLVTSCGGIALKITFFDGKIEKEI